MTNLINKEIVSPVLESGQGSLFHVAGTNFKITGSHIETITETNDLFQTLVAANKVFDINETGVSFYYDYNRKKSITKIEEGSLKNFSQFLELNDKLDFLKESAKDLRLSGNKGDALSKVNKEIEDTGMLIAESKDKSLVIEFRYVAESNTFFAGNIEIPIENNESLAERFFTIGYIKYADKSLLEAFQIAAENFTSFKVLDFVVESKSNQITVATMRAESKVYTYRVNEDTKLGKFQQLLADAAVEYVATETGALAEADRNLPDIKAADSLIESEIKKIESDLKVLQEEELGIEDGYVSASLKGEVDGLPEDSQVKVDAVEFNQAGKNDILTVFVENKPFRVEKYKINISQEDNV